MKTRIIFERHFFYWIKVLMEKYSPVYLTIFYLREIVGVIANVIIFGHCHVLQLGQFESIFEMHHA